VSSRDRAFLYILPLCLCIVYLKIERVNDLYMNIGDEMFNMVHVRDVKTDIAGMIVVSEWL
jgi:hypothetical protein